MIGKTVSHYKIREKLGEGGMGVVYKAEDTKLKRTVALKFLLAQAVGGEEDKTRFIHEAQAAAALNHPNICTIYEIGEWEGQSFIVMEYVEGESLSAKIQSGPLELDAAIAIAVEIAEGLGEAHDKGIVHRDIKPGNIMLTVKGRAKVMDFGLAKSRDRVQLTKTGTTIGTVAYMSPEQARGASVDRRTDIWSVGVVLYEMVSGQRPFKGDHEQAVLYSVVNEEPEPITGLRSRVPIDLDRIVAKCLAKDPAERYQTTADLVADCRRVRRELSERTSVSKVTARSAIQPKAKIRRIATAALGGVAALIVLGLLFDVGGLRQRLFRTPGPDGSKRIESLAILPFVNTGSEPDTEYLSDEIPASIMDNLSRLPNLRVVPRSTVFRYRGREDDLGAVGRELKVGAILTGEIGVRGDRLNIRTELVDVAGDRQLWGNRYTRKLADIIDLETRIAEEISDALKLQLTGEARTRLTQHATENPEAHQLYLKGRHFWNKRTEEATEKAIDYFQQAIDKDPAYALAYTGLADSYSILVGYGLAAPREAFPKAKAAAVKALEIDDALAEAHTSLAAIKEGYDWDWVGAEREYKRAIELNPTYATAFQWYSLALVRAGRWDEAVAAAKRAQELDPLSLPISGCMAVIHHMSRQYDEAIKDCSKPLELDPDYAPARTHLGLIYTLMGEYEKAIEELNHAVRLSDRAPEDLGYLGYAYAVAGMPVDARRILDELNSRATRRYVPPSYFAMIHTGLGEYDEAFDWFDKAYEARDGYLSFELIEPIFDPIQNDPRFEDLIRRVGTYPSMFTSRPATGPVSGKIILAVLPFDNLSPDPDQEYFSDGMTEEVIAQLGRLQPKRLGVIARTTAMKYKNTDKGIRQIGRELGVDYVLEGSVRRASGRVRISVNLVQVSDETQVWVDTREHELADVFAVQSDVAEGVAEALALELLPSERARLTTSQPVVPEAYEAYLLGRYHWNKRTKDEVEKSVECFERAIERAPGYATAYVGLAEAYTVMGMWGFIPAREAAAQSEKYAMRAIQIDDMLGSAYSVLGGVAWYHWKWAQSEDFFKKAIELSPNYATAHQWYAELLSDVQRHDEALERMRRALELDPLSLVMNASMGALYYYARRYDDAIEQCNKVLEMQSDFWMADFYLWQVYIQKEMYAEAVDHFQMCLADDEKREMRAVYETSGIEGVYRWITVNGEELTYETFNRAYLVAMAHALLGETEEALRWLEKAYETGSGFFARVPEDSAFDNIRSDPGYSELLARVGLEP